MLSVFTKADVSAPRPPAKYLNLNIKVLRICIVMRHLYASHQEDVFSDSYITVFAEYSLQCKGFKMQIHMFEANTKADIKSPP